MASVAKRTQAAATAEMRTPDARSTAAGTGRTRAALARRMAARGGPAAHYRQIALLADGLVLCVAFPLAYLAKTRLLPADFTPLYAPEVYLAPAALVALATLFVLERRGAHTPVESLSSSAIVRTVFFAVGSAIMFGATLLFAFKVAYVSRLFLALYGITSAVLLTIVHFGLRWFVSRSRAIGAASARILLVGSEAESERLAQALSEGAPFGVTVVDRFSAHDLRQATRPVPVGQQVEFPALDALLADEAIDEVAVATTDIGATDLAELASACDREGVLLHVAVAGLGPGFEHAVLEQVGDVALLSINPQVHSAWARAAKRALDLVLAPVLLVASAPLWLAIALAIKIDSPGPILFRQTRLGLNKRRFRILKFRTMRQDAERRREEIEALNEADGPMFKVRRDPRVTRVGRILRRFDLDELPQLLNVLAGQMTLVGPRPMLPGEVTDFASWQRKRFSMHPGITGAWQVSHALGDPFLTGLHADLDYIEHWSLMLDLRILVRTLPAVLRNREGK